MMTYIRKRLLRIIPKTLLRHMVLSVVTEVTTKRKASLPTYTLCKLLGIEGVCDLVRKGNVVSAANMVYNSINYGSITLTQRDLTVVTSEHTE